MSLISWNYRGLGNPPTVKALQKMVQQKEPILVFLIETKLNKERVEMVKDKCNFKFSWVVPCVGRSGGLALFRKEGIKVAVLEADRTRIDTLVMGGVSTEWWHFTGFYGALETAKRDESWALLMAIRDRSSLPWLVVGDFNEITRESEKEGGSSRPRRQIKNFTDTLNWCELRDVGFIEPCFTWLYHKADGGQIRERLDRALASFAWGVWFPEAKVYHITSSASDHSPILLRFFLKHKKRGRRKIFRFESMWLKDPKCEEIVKECLGGWKGACLMIDSRYQGVWSFVETVWKYGIKVSLGMLV